MKLLDQDLKRFRDARLRYVFALDDRFKRLDASDNIVRLDRQNLLKRIGRSIRFERPDLHLTETLAAELCFTAERLLCNK